MKLTVNQLRRIIKEEVSRVMEMGMPVAGVAGGDPGFAAYFGSIGWRELTGLRRAIRAVQGVMNRGADKQKLAGPLRTLVDELDAVMDMNGEDPAVQDFHELIHHVLSGAAPAAELTAGFNVIAPPR